MAHANSIIHDLINKEREHRGIPRVRWDQNLYLLAKAHTNDMARKGYQFHSNRKGLQGGELCYMTIGKLVPQNVVSTWLSSALHRAWLLYRGVQNAGVAYTSSKDGTYVAWSFTGIGDGPEIVRRVYDEWEREAKGMPWLKWLSKKRYIRGKW